MLSLEFKHITRPASPDPLTNPFAFLAILDMGDNRDTRDMGDNRDIRDTSNINDTIDMRDNRHIRDTSNINDTRDMSDMGSNYFFHLLGWIVPRVF